MTRFNRLEFEQVEDPFPQPHAMACRGDIKTAIAACDAALAQPGQSWYPWLVRGELMVIRKESAQEHCFDKAAQISNDSLVPLEIGLIYLHHKKPAKALPRL